MLWVHFDGSINVLMSFSRSAETFRWWDGTLIDWCMSVVYMFFVLFLTPCNMLHKHFTVLQSTCDNSTSESESESESNVSSMSWLETMNWRGIHLTAQPLLAVEVEPHLSTVAHRTRANFYLNVTAKSYYQLTWQRTPLRQINTTIPLINPDIDHVSGGDSKYYMTWEPLH